VFNHLGCDLVTFTRAALRAFAFGLGALRMELVLNPASARRARRDCGASFVLLSDPLHLPVLLLSLKCFNSLL